MQQLNKSVSTSPVKKTWTTPAIEKIELNAARMPKNGVNVDSPTGNSKS